MQDCCELRSIAVCIHNKLKGLFIIYTLAFSQAACQAHILALDKLQWFRFAIAVVMYVASDAISAYYLEDMSRALIIMIHAMSQE